MVAVLHMSLICRRGSSAQTHVLEHSRQADAMYLVFTRIIVSFALAQLGAELSAEEECGPIPLTLHGVPSLLCTVLSLGQVHPFMISPLPASAQI